MSASGNSGVRWGDVLLASIAAVSWALVGMAGVASLGLHLLGADSAGSLGPMTAAVVVLGAGGSVSPSGDVSAFGLEGAEATTAVDITPLGVGLAGALLLSFFFLRSLRGAGKTISVGELAARAGAVAVLFVATMGGLAWAGHDVITIDGDALGPGLGLDQVPGGDAPGGIGELLPDGLGDIGGLLPDQLPDRLADLADAKASVGFSVNTGESLVGAACWVLGVLVVALLASRRTPLPRGWDAVHRVVRPAVSALVTVLVVAVLAGLAAAAYAAVGDDHPKRIAGAALLGAPNGVWLGIPLGLLVPWDGRATGELAKVLPDPLDELLRVNAAEPVTLGRLAGLDGRVWLLGIAVAVMMLYAGVLTAARTPRGHGAPLSVAGADRARGELSVVGFAGRCAVRLGVATGVALPLLVWLTDVSADASLSVLGVDAFGAGIELHGSVPMAVLLGAVWGAGAGGLGALLT
ncbi:streptophobe family protein, partial [Streptomyces sp. ISL-100]|uniref:streptophobe family protein n=1 Tax=Streptomyces sp. ISL-100 TaxID=2819173 RepID=UPI001BE8AF8E